MHVVSPSGDEAAMAANPSHVTAAPVGVSVPLAGVAARANTDRLTATAPATTRPSATRSARCACRYRIRLLLSLHAVTERRDRDSAVQLFESHRDRQRPQPRWLQGGKDRAERTFKPRSGSLHSSRSATSGSRRVARRTGTTPVAS